MDSGVGFFEAMDVAGKKGSGKNEARLERLELPTRCLEGSCSIHLSYRRPFRFVRQGDNRGGRI